MKTFKQYESIQNLITKKLGNVSICESNYYINEGIRDKMTPKSKEDLLYLFSEVLDKESYNLLSEFQSKSPIYSNINLLTRDLGDISDLYITNFDEDEFWKINNLFKMLTEGEEYDDVEIGSNTFYSIKNGIWNVYPNLNIMGFKMGNNMLCWIFNKPFIQNLISERLSIKESLRDKMTPKSEKELFDNFIKLSTREKEKFLWNHLMDKNGMRTTLKTFNNLADYSTESIDDALINLFKKEYGVNESIRDKMTPISSDGIISKLSKLKSYKLCDYLAQFILDNNKDLIVSILTKVDTSILDEGEIHNLMEIAIDMRNMTVIHYFLDKGLSNEILEDLYTYADERDMERISKLINSRIKINESIRDKMTPISDTKKEELKNKILDMERDKKVSLMLEYPELFNDQQLRDAIISIQSSSLKNNYILRKYPHLFTDKEKDDVSKRIVHKYFESAYKDGKTWLDREILGNRLIFDEYIVGHNKYLFDDAIFTIKQGKKGIQLVRTDIDPQYNLELFDNEYVHKKSPNELLFLGSKYGIVELVQIALRKGVDINTKDIDSNSYEKTPLIYASMNGYTEIVNILVDNGADLEVKDTRGFTPLMRATVDGHTEIVDILTNKGADVNVKAHGVSILKFAHMFNHPDIIKILKKHGAIYENYKKF